MATEQNTDRIEALREVYYEAIEKIAPEDLIFIDETGTNQAMTPLYGRAPKGHRLYESRPVQRGRLYTVIGALSLGGMLTVMTGTLAPARCGRTYARPANRAEGSRSCT